MNRTKEIAARAVHCPECGYDLRASPRGAGGVRCSECGKVTAVSGEGGLTASRVPWVQRRWRGRVKTFVLTVWLAVVRPGKLAREVEVRGRLRDGRRFQWICLVLATVAGCAFMEGANVAWRGELVPAVLDYPTLAPAFVLLDRWFGVLPLALGVFLATWACMGLYRRIVMLGGGHGWRGEPGYERRRLAGLSYYTTALWMVEMVLAGWIWIFWLMWLDEAGRRRGGDVRFAATLTLVAGGAAAALYLVTSLGLVLRTGRWRWLRATMIVVYPAVAAVLWLAVMLAVNWAVGYVVLGVRSMVE